MNRINEVNIVDVEKREQVVTHVVYVKLKEAKDLIELFIHLLVLDLLVCNFVEVVVILHHKIVDIDDFLV